MSIKKTIAYALLCILFFGCYTNPGLREGGKITTSGAANEPLASSVDDILTISYIGNMGILIENKGKTVLIDGFHEAYKPDYLFPTEMMVEALIAGRYQGFSKIDITLVTHMHRDHFSAAYVKRFLDKNPNAIAVGAPQIKEEVRSQPSDESTTIESSVKAVAYDKKKHLLQHNGIDVTAIQCDHVNPSRHGKIQNIAYLVDINGYTVLHVGDTHWRFTATSLYNLQLKNEAIDVAILPYWMLYEKDLRTKIRTIIKSKKIIATHIPSNFSEKDQKDLLKNNLDIIPFTTLEETISYKKPMR